MHKKTLALIIVLIFSLVARPVVAQDGSQLGLQPCKLAVGLGAAKHDVDAQCGSMQVPEIWGDPNSNTLDIHFAILPALNSDKKALPIFHLEGGPGISAIYNFGLSWYPSYLPLRQNHDIVIIDQRGMGQSAPLQCTEITETALQDLGSQMSDEEARAHGAAQLKACLERLSKTNDPANFTSLSLADDTDAIREALGYDQINVLGGSYGTWLGQIYLGRHGEHVNAMLLDGTLGPWNQPYLAVSANAQASLDKVFELCKADPSCNAAFPDVPGKLKEALDKLEQNPVTTTGNSSVTNAPYPIRMTRGRFLDALRLMLTSGSSLGSIPQAIYQAASGVYTLPAATIIAQVELADVHYGSYFSIVCAETAAFYTPDLIKQYTSDAFYGLGKAPGADLQAACGAWRSGEIDEKDVAPVKSDRPVLLLVGAFDPITAPAFSEEAKARLSNSTLIVFPYQSHGVVASSKCAQNLAVQFFDDPSTPLDSSCAANDVKPLFSGAYTVRLVPYHDPDGKFNVNIPDGWQPQPGDGPLTFFHSPDNLQMMGAGIFENTPPDQAQKAAIESIRAAYGDVEIQISLNTFGTTIIQHSISGTDQALTGVMVVMPFGRNTNVLWQAAPNNMILAAVSAILPNVLLTLTPG